MNLGVTYPPPARALFPLLLPPGPFAMPLAPSCPALPSVSATFPSPPSVFLLATADTTTRINAVGRRYVGGLILYYPRR